jgi:hypothetical protein
LEAVCARRARSPKYLGRELVLTFGIPEGSIDLQRAEPTPLPKRPFSE